MLGHLIVAGDCISFPRVCVPLKLTKSSIARDSGGSESDRASTNYASSLDVALPTSTSRRFDCDMAIGVRTVPRGNPSVENTLD